MAWGANATGVSSLAARWHARGVVGRSSLVMEKKQCVGDRGKRSFVFKYAELEELMKNIRKFYRL